MLLLSHHRNPYGGKKLMYFVVRCTARSPQDNGLYNEELVRANAILTIDTDPGFYSLNLGQAVLIVCYELFRCVGVPVRWCGRLCCMWTTTCSTSCPVRM